MRKIDVAIAGAGIAGLATAIFLRKQKHNVIVYDQLETPSPVGSGFLLQPTGRAILEIIGVNEAVCKLGARIDRLYGVTAATGRTALDVRYSTPVKRAGADTKFGIGVHRAALFSLLFDEATRLGVDFQYDRRIESFINSSGDKAKLIFKNGARSASADLLIDALGVSSSLAPVKPLYLTYGALWTNIPFKDEFGLNANFIEQRYLKARQAVGVMPIGSLAENGPPEAALFWNLKQNAYKTWRANGVTPWKEEILRLWPELRPAIRAITSTDQIVMARYAHKTLREPFGKGIAHIGDAYHSASPQIGQGANMALLDAYAISLAINSHTELDDALLAFKKLRHFHVRLYQTISRAFTPVYQSDSNLLPLVRDILAAPMARMPLVKPLLSAMLSGALGGPLQKLGLKQ